MPLYEYRCDRCEKVHEVIQKFSDAPLTECPEDGCKGALQKLMSRTSFALKGTGWYTTDYKRAAAPAVPAAGATTPTATPAKTDGAPAAAPAATPAPAAKPDSTAKS